MNFENLQQLMLDESYLDNDAKIFLKKEISNLLKEAKANAKISRCMICGKNVEGFCKSHFVPQFCLKHIGTRGTVLYYNTLINCPVLKEYNGIGEAGVFYNICNDCDNTLFQDYENPQNLLQPPTSKMLAEIALKNYLKLLYKNRIEHEIYKLCIAKFPIPLNFILPENIFDINHLDYNKYSVGFEKAKRLSHKAENNGYYLIDYKLLNYRAPLTFQGAITLVADLAGQVVNDVYNFNPKYKPSELHIAVFPLEEKTAVIMFMDDGAKKFKNFIKQFKNLPFDDQLWVICYLILLYSEDFFFSESICKMKELDILKYISGKTPLVLHSRNEDILKGALEEFDLSKMKQVPNLLSREYALF